MNGTVWIMSYVLLWATVGVLSFAVVALLRQVGVLHTRVAPMGVHFAGEGPALDEAAPMLDDVDYGANAVTLIAFTTADCEICARLKPGLERLDAGYDEVSLHIVDHSVDAEVFGRFTVRSTPYLVAVDGDGIVRSRGVANSLDQAEEMLAEVMAGPPIEDGAGEIEGAPVAAVDLDTLLADLERMASIDGSDTAVSAAAADRDTIDADDLLAELAAPNESDDHPQTGNEPSTLRFLSDAEADDLLALDLTESETLDLTTAEGAGEPDRSAPAQPEVDTETTPEPDLVTESDPSAGADTTAHRGPRFVVTPDGVTVDVSGPETELVVTGDPMVEGFAVLDIAPDPLVVDPLVAFSTPHSVASGTTEADQSDDDLAADLRVHLTEAMRP